MSIESAILQPHFKSEYHKMAINILYTAGWLQTLNNRVLKTFGLTSQQYNVLRILRGQKGKAISVQAIASRMLDQNSNASRLIDKLVDKNLLTRQICLNDRRQADILITQQGLELLKELDSPIEEIQGHFKNLSEEEAQTLNLLLDKLRND
jgi:DNA-binding MarR family transcriptional regulator